MSMYDDLRADLHFALDQAFDAWLARQAPTGSGELHVEKAGELTEPFIHRWPDGSDETFSRGAFFLVEAAGERLAVLVAFAEEPRFTWGRERRRAVSFWLPRGRSGAERYPLSEWVETDDGRMSIGVPDPTRPRALIKEGDEAPAWLKEWTVQRADEIFESVSNGPSLRLIVSATDEASMAVCAVRVGLVRGRFPAGTRRTFGDWSRLRREH